MNTNKNIFCLFAGGFYYPEGGAIDFRGFGTVDDLKALYVENNEKWAENNGRRSWGHICEHSTMKIIWAANHRRDGLNWEEAITN